jgi:AcrR family transcriptional regulator
MTTEKKARGRSAKPRQTSTNEMALTALRRRPTQARGVQRVTEVLDACERLLANRRFEDLTMEDIARSAKIQVGSLYHFFPDKTAVIVTVLERILLDEGSVFDVTPADARRDFVDYIAALEARMISVWRSHGSLLDLYFAFQRHPLVWKLTLAQRHRTAIQVGAKLRQLMPKLSHRRALEQGRIVSMVMGVLIDNLVFLPEAAQRTLRRETYDMLSRYVGLAR